MSISVSIWEVGKREWLNVASNIERRILMQDLAKGNSSSRLWSLDLLNILMIFRVTTKEASGMHTFNNSRLFLAKAGLAIIGR